MPTYFGYYRTQAVGSGTVADIAGRAFANLLTASSGKKNICSIFWRLVILRESSSGLSLKLPGKYYCIN